MFAFNFISYPQKSYLSVCQPVKYHGYLKKKRKTSGHEMRSVYVWHMCVCEFLVESPCDSNVVPGILLLPRGFLQYN